MVLIYHECGSVLQRAQAMYEARYGRRPSRRTILDATYRFRENGEFSPPEHHVGRPRFCPEFEQEIIDFFRRHPMASTRDAVRVFNVSQFYVWNILGEEGLHPFHFTEVQELTEADYAPRIQFCRWLREERRNILWTDESTFTRVGMFNIHNSHFWTENNPRLVRPSHFQHRFSVNVWAGIMNERVFGPIFLNRLNADTYLDLLRRLERKLENMPLSDTRGMYFQHDGAPAHFSLRVREYLNSEYGERWIGRGGPVEWPARSPDLTPLDFFLWGRVKELVYGQDGHTIQNVRQLKRRIKRAFRVLKRDHETLRQVRRHVQRRAYACIEREGGFVQQLLN